MTTNKSIATMAVGAVVALGGIALGLLVVQRLTDRGLAADANGTAGFTTAGDILQGGGGVALVLAGIALVIWGLVSRGRG